MAVWIETISVVAQVVVVKLTHLLVEIQAAATDGTTHVALPPAVETITVVPVPARRHTRLLSLPVLQKADRALLHTLLLGTIVGHWHEELQVAKGKSKAGTAQGVTGSVVAAQAAGETQRRETERMWLCIESVLLAEEGDEGGENQQHHQRCEQDHEGAVIGSPQIQFVTHPYRNLLRVIAYMMLHGYLGGLLAEVCVQVFVSILVVHEFDAYDDPAEGLVFLTLDANVVGGEGGTAVLLQDQFGSLEHRGRLPQGPVIAFRLDVEERGPSRGVGAHADREHQLVVVHLLRLVVQVAVVAAHPQRPPQARQLTRSQLALLPYEALRATAATIQTPSAVEAVAWLCRGTKQAGQEQRQHQQHLPPPAIKYIGRQHYYQRTARHFKTSSSPQQQGSPTSIVLRGAAGWCMLNKIRIILALPIILLQNVEYLKLQL